MLTLLCNLFIMFIKRPLVFIVILFVGGLMIGKSLFYPSPEAPGKTLPLSGIIRSEPGTAYGRTSFVLKTKEFGNINLSVKPASDEFRYGDSVQVRALLQTYPEPTNPSLSSYGEYLKTKRIYFHASVRQSDIRIIQRNCGNPLMAFSIWLKNQLVPITQKTLPDPYNALLGSIIFGTSAAPLPKDIQLTYKKAGVIHLLVVSGSQIALLVGICLKICQGLRFSSLLTFFIVSFFNIVFTLMTGADPSITRACIMAEVALTGKLLGRDADVYTTMAAAALISLLINPLTIFNVGFQLSFAATWALVYIAPVLETALKKKLPGWAAAPLAISLAPTLTTLPLTVYYFAALSVVSLPMNLIVISWVEILVTLGFLATILGVIWLPLAIIVNGTNFALLYILDKLVNFFAGIPYAYVFIQPPHWIFVIMYYAALIWFIEYLQKEGAKGLRDKGTEGNSECGMQNADLNTHHSSLITRYSGLPELTTIKRFLPLLALLFFLVAWLAFSNNKLLTITMLDTGQGDSILIEAPNGKKMLIDAGDGKAGERAVVPVLQQKGINKIDILVSTHAHADHIGGFPYFLKNIRPKLLLDTDPAISPGKSGGQPVQGNWYFREYRRQVKKKKIPHRLAAAGQTINLADNIKAFILHPSTPFLKDTPSDDNENSVVIKLVYKNFSILLPGDLGHAGEERLLGYVENRKLPISSLRSTILKAGHHGSRHSSSDEFLDAVRPSAALISCGKGNRFKHPHQSVVDKLKKRDIRIYRTDHHGAVIIKTDGKKYWIKTMVKGSFR
ncbi:ComEC/Rec2 family competence protein [Candidatus Margulisiibacteriota bacterium]